MNCQTSWKGILIYIKFSSIRTQQIEKKMFFSWVGIVKKVSTFTTLIPSYFFLGHCTNWKHVRQDQILDSLNDIVMLINVFFKGTFQANSNNRHKPLNIGYAWQNAYTRQNECFVFVCHHNKKLLSLCAGSALFRTGRNHGQIDKMV